MGKGIGMVAARQVATGKMVRAALVDGSAAPFACLGCGVPVERVSGYWVHKEDPELAREVHAFFRLKRGEDNQHGATCPFTPAGQVKILVDEAEAVEDSVNPFERRRPNGPVVFRLNIAEEEVRREGAAEPPGRRLEAYCRSAVGLAKLWQALEGPDAQAELKKCVRIEQAGKQVPWEDFFFPPERIKRFADRFENDRYPPPVALLLHAQGFRP